MRGLVDVDEANELIAEAGHDDLRFLDNGAINRKMEAHRRNHARLPPGPGGASKGKGVAAHMRARGYAPRTASRSATRSRTSRPPLRSAASSASPTGPARREPLRRGDRRHDNVTVTEGAMGDGFYEAVVSTLAMG